MILVHRVTTLCKNKQTGMGDRCNHSSIPLFTYTQAPVTRSETEELVKILDTDGNGTVNILELDKIIRKHHRALQSRAPSFSSDEEIASMSAVSLLLSPSRVSEKCPRCDIGLAEPPPDMNVR